MSDLDRFGRESGASDRRRDSNTEHGRETKNHSLFHSLMTPFQRFTFRGFKKALGHTVPL
jgi:hypothetical protein